MSAVGLRRSGLTIGDGPVGETYDPSTPDPIERLNSALEGRYSVLRELGRGGMATVYLAKDVRHDRDVAIKVLLPDLSATIGTDRFEREIKVAAKLQHPHILGLFDSGQANGLLFYVMPFVQGESLGDRIEREGPLPIDEALVIALEVADALGYAHQQGVIHRDIKPDNIMLSGGHALVTDFGIARAVTDAVGTSKLTQTGASIGTPVYMSPEQSGGADVGPPADIYSLACVLYEMLAGEPPFTGKSSMVIMARHAMEQVPSIRIVRASVPEEVEAAIFAGMAKMAADRPKSAKEFAEILGMPLHMTATLRVTTGPTGMRRVATPSMYTLTAVQEPPPPVPWWKRPAFNGVALVAVVAALVGVLLSQKRAAVPADEFARRVAVLYFTDQSREKDLGPLADGLTEGLIGSLSNASSITVISRGGVERFRGSDITPDSIARVLRAGFLVRGDLEHSGDNIALNVRLDDRSGATINRARLTVSAANPLAIRDSLQNTVSSLIKSSLHQEIQLREERASTSNQAAWLELQRGEQVRKTVSGLVKKGDTLALKAAISSADSLLASAEKQDPKWAEPVTRRAQLALELSRTLSRDPAVIRNWYDIGMGHVTRSLALDADSPDALEVRGTFKFWAWLSNLETDAHKKEQLLLDAKADLERSTQLNKGQASAYATLASVYYQVPSATTSDVYLAANKAYETDEFLANAPIVLHRLFLAAYDLNAADKANQHCNTYASRFPADYRSHRCRLFMMTMDAGPKADVALAKKMGDSIVAMRAPKDSLFERYNSNQLVAQVMARASKQAPALAAEARALSKASIGDASIDPNHDNTFYAARVFNMLGDTPETITLLKAYFAASPQRLVTMRGDPGWWFKNVENEPAWKQLIR